ncbi:hypothetical protein LMJF_10_0185 [Leishmania major strain Friedlin]|uniref:Uncharacterized protein n=1 Tax=Leishmania major TaxID=5664 RepID=Q4QHK1_LEIMA|nr:hypothetical protein LMJF_10_0185 [Leishmania major strain Friedlin]CAG9569991.1 hypothetical_protein_-_conserved [Leishmania major strain Friedlin]CAJ02402.1 hypothetical protein LMJF_10_0185 [Leishmania major strain Friedlin]|eukprot:XP_001681347.1 hypothetical protein LMJF_10_0185 [Leishmania major strain Friedlin]
MRGTAARTQRESRNDEEGVGEEEGGACMMPGVEQAHVQHRPKRIHERVLWTGWWFAALLPFLKMLDLCPSPGSFFVWLFVVTHHFRWRDRLFCVQWCLHEGVAALSTRPPLLPPHTRTHTHTHRGERTYARTVVGSDAPKKRNAQTKRDLRDHTKAIRPVVVVPARLCDAISRVLLSSEGIRRGSAGLLCA